MASTLVGLFQTIISDHLTKEQHFCYDYDAFVRVKFDTLFMREVAQVFIMFLFCETIIRMSLTMALMPGSPSNI